MVYKKEFTKTSVCAQKVFVLESKLLSEDLYTEVEKILCGGARSGRNLDALRDILCGGFGDLGENDVKIILTKSKILRPKILKVFKDAAEENENLVVEYR